MHDLSLICTLHCGRESDDRVCWNVDEKCVHVIHVYKSSQCVNGSSTGTKL